jgi:hypothetical protein
MANWPGNIGGRQCSGGDLIEQWLKTVIILPIEYSDFDWRAS